LIPRAQVLAIYQPQLRLPPIMSTQSAIMTKEISHAYSIDGHLLV